MVLKYKMKGNKCVTRCPVDNDSNENMITKIGSYSCKNECESNIMSDDNRQKVLCAHPDLFKKKRGKK